MRVVLYTEGEFPEALAAELKPWAHRFAESLHRQGITVSFFRREAPDLQPTDIVHVFGCAKPENWYWLKQHARAVVVSPLPGERLAAPHPWRARLRRLCGRQGKLHFDTFRSAVDAFRELSPATEAATAAQQMMQVYAEYSRPA